MTPHQFVGGFKGNISGCEWRGQPLGCEFVVPKRNPALHAQSGISKVLTRILACTDIQLPFKLDLLTDSA